MKRIFVILLILSLSSCINSENKVKFLERMGTLKGSGGTNVYYSHYLFIGDSSLDSYLDIARQYADTCVLDTPIVSVTFIDESNGASYNDDAMWYSSPRSTKVRVSKLNIKDTVFSKIQYYLEDEIKVIEIKNGVIKDSHQKNLY